MKLVVEEKIKTVEKSSDENLIFTTETVSNVGDIITKETMYSANTVEYDLNTETFLTKVDNQDGDYIFVYNEQEDKWFDNEDNEIDLSEYGITLDNEPFDKDRIEIYVEEGEITAKDYIQHHTIIGETFCNFFDFSSELEVELEIVIGEQTLNIKTRKCQLKFESDTLKLDIWHNNKKDFKVKTVVTL